MSYTVRIVRSAQKELERLPEGDYRRIKAAIQGLATDPRPRQSKKLVESSNWRLRVGAYRVIYNIDDDVLTVVVVKVGQRGNVYR